MTDHVPAPEQQGEPVCARCRWEESNWRHDTPFYEETIREYHPFELAPPPSEEAEARRWLRAEESPDFVVWRVNNKDGLPVAAQTISKELEAAIRRPIEEERDRLRAMLHSQVQELREALRGMLLAWYSASGGDDLMNLMAGEVVRTSSRRRRNSRRSKSGRRPLRQEGRRSD